MRTLPRATAALVALVLVAPEASGATPRFADVADSAGVGQWTRTWGAAWADVDGGRRPELFVDRHPLTPWLFRNRDAGFALAPQRAFRAQMDRHGCAWGEADGDGRLDLYCVQGADWGAGTGPNQLFVHARDRLAERARAFGVRDARGRGRSVNWLDYDGDGDLDLFVGNQRRRRHPNALFRNDRGSFARVRAGVRASLRTKASAWADWDRDGDPDLLVLRGSAGPIAYRNDGGRFERVQLGSGLERRWSSAAFGDYDGDGWIDLHVVRFGASLVLRNVGGRFEPATSPSLRRARASAWIDVDADGDLDLFVVRGRGPAARRDRPDVVLVNDDGAFVAARHVSWAGRRSGSGDAVAVADHDRDGDVDAFVTNGHGETSGKSVLLDNRTRGGAWVALDLAGPRVNPAGFGAVVTVGSDGASYVRPLTDGVSGRAQSEVGHVHLGIGDAARASVRVEWPNGVADCVALDAGETAVVAIGGSPCLSAGARRLPRSP